MASNNLLFKLIPFEGKTKRWNVLSKHNQDISLGTIKWFSNWRRYCFYPNNDCIFDASCMTEIVSFINTEMDNRK